jgi:hypothetical protein
LELGILGKTLLRMATLLAVAVLPWKERKAEAMKAPGFSFNKSHFGSQGSGANIGLCSSKRHGGEMRKEQAVLRDRISLWYGLVMMQNQGEHSRWPKVLPPTLKTNWWSSSKPAVVAKASLTPKRWPLLKPATAPHFLSEISRFVPIFGEEGFGWSFNFFGKCKEPIAFSYFL